MRGGDAVLPGEVAGEDEAEEGEQEKRAGEIEEEVVVEMGAEGAGRMAAVVAFAGVVMVLAHGGGAGR